MTSFRRLMLAAGLGLALAAFHFAPLILPLGPDGVVAMTIVAQIGGPLLAALYCLRAAGRNRGDDRTAWLLFGAGSAVYVLGNLGYLVYSLFGPVPAFPTPVEAAFFIMAGLFAAGMFKYGNVQQRVSRVQVYNFVLIFCALTLAIFFLLHDAITSSVLSPTGTLVAFLYPALWGSVAAFGAVSFLVYDHRRKAFPFYLLLLAITAEAVADFAYVRGLLDGTYAMGGPIQLLWIASAGLIAWAALEEPAEITTSEVATRAEVRRRNDGRYIVQAALPAVAVAIILVPGMLSGALGEGFIAVAAGFGIVFAVVVGLREHNVIDTQRALRADIEDSHVALLDSEAMLTAVLESTTDSIVVLDAEWRFEFINRHTIDLVGSRPLFKIGESVWDAFPELDDVEAGAHYRRAMETRAPISFETAGDRLWLDVHVYPTAKGGLAIFLRDISEARKAQNDILHMALHDPLTGLANRALFHQRLVEATASGVPSATLLLDLDHFKEVNDSLGHPVGDRLLAATAQRLRQHLKREDTIARLGGDEFAIILAGGPEREDVETIARDILSVVQGPHEAEGQSITVGASLGIALSSGHADDADRVLRAADIALYAAKADARGTFRFFDPAMEAGLLARQALRSQLSGAIERGEFELVYQPIVDLSTQQVASFEALLRWRHPTHGLVPPSVFIPVAEETGLIVPIGAWVLRTACAEAVKWPADVSVAINLSPQQFRHGEIAIDVEEALEASGLSSRRLELEITESVLLNDSNANTATLHRLRGLGIRIALDDFGTGYSSLGYLQHFPFSKIKIDRSFINGLPDNEESQAIVKMVIGLGKALGLRITAEGVETEAQLAWVRRGCDEAQGYLLSKPVPATEIPSVIHWRGAPAGRERMRA